MIKQLLWPKDIQTKKSFNNVKKSTYILGSNENFNIDEINDTQHINIKDTGESGKIKKVKSKKKSTDKNIKLKQYNTYALILRNANNELSPVPYQSDYIINNFDYDEAIKYEDRTFCRIFCIIFIAKENVLNMIFFSPH